MKYVKNLLILCGLMLAAISYGACAADVHYIYTDVQGTPLAEADVNGSITSTFDYTPYGNEALGNPISGQGFTGQFYDQDADFIYMQARYLDSDSGRFLSADPAGLTEGNFRNFNRFSYANNSPINFIDPSGAEAAYLIPAAECAVFGCENYYGGGPQEDNRQPSSQDVTVNTGGPGNDDPKQTVVEIWYKSIGGHGYNHAFIVITAPDGQQAFVRAGPSGGGNGGLGQLVSDGSGSGAGYGKLVVNSGPYVPGTVDYTTAPTAVQRVLTTSEAPDQVFNKLVSFGEAVNNAGITYHPLSTNSNAFAHQAVTVLGVSRPSAKVWAPGSNKLLNVPGGGL